MILIMIENNYFVSEGFYNICDGLSIYELNSYDLIQVLIWIGVSYKQLFDEQYPISEWIFELINKHISLYGNENINIDNEILKEFVVDDIYNKIIAICNNNLSQIKTYMCERLFKIYQYHAFNSVCYESIKEHGIDPKYKFTSQESLNKIDSIFKKYHICDILGWQQLNCINKVSYSKTALVSGYYAYNSPEWFSQFTGANYIYDKVLFSNTKLAFVNRLYEDAKSNLLFLMNLYQFSLNDRKNVINFFEENWGIYSMGKPMLLVNCENVDCESLLSNLSDKLLTKILKSMLRNMLYASHNDISITNIINKNNAEIFLFPEYNKVKQRLKRE